LKCQDIADLFSKSKYGQIILSRIMVNNWLVVEPTPLKNDGVKVSWDDDIPS